MNNATNKATRTIFTCTAPNGYSETYYTASPVGSAGWVTECITVRGAFESKGWTVVQSGAR